MGDQIFRLFSTPVFKTDIDDTLRKKTLLEVKKLKESQSGYQQKRNWFSNDDLHEKEEFSEITNVISNCLSNVLDHITIKRKEEFITCMWANINKVGYMHPAHSHANSLFSGIIYLQCPSGSGSTYFTDPRPAATTFNFEVEDPVAEWYNVNNWAHPATEGALLIFPSWLNHGVDYSNFDNDQERITIAFNTFLRADMNFVTRKLSL
jgi:uncharacterized protein (TIGR02466 family)